MSTEISVRLPRALAERLENIARETEMSRPLIIQKALESYLAAFGDEQIASDRLNNSSDTIISGEELRKSLGV